MTVSASHPLCFGMRRFMREYIPPKAILNGAEIACHSELSTPAGWAVNAAFTPFPAARKRTMYFPPKLKYYSLAPPTFENSHSRYNLYYRELKNDIPVSCSSNGLNSELGTHRIDGRGNNCIDHVSAVFLTPSSHIEAWEIGYLRNCVPSEHVWHDNEVACFCNTISQPATWCK